jgi:hypothetical protein
VHQLAHSQPINENMKAQMRNIELHFDRLDQQGFQFVHRRQALEQLGSSADGRSLAVELTDAQDAQLSLCALLLVISVLQMGQARGAQCFY